MAALSEAVTVFDGSNIVMMVSNPIQDMDICPCSFSVCVV